MTRMQRKIQRCGERLAHCAHMAEIAVGGVDWEAGAVYLALAMEDVGPDLREVVAFARRYMRKENIEVRS